MAALLFSLLDNFENGHYFSLALELFWNFSKSLVFQILSWWIWLLHTSVRFFFEWFWELIARAILPFIWPVFLFTQLTFISDISSSACSGNRNSFQKLSPRKKRQSDNYNISCYWYLGNMKCTVINKKYGHIMQGDLDKSLLISNSIWAASVFLSFPYKVFHTPPKKPPDGCVLRALVLLYVILMAVIAIIHSMTNILGIKLGIIWIQDETSKDSKDNVLPNACFAFTVVHALRSVDLNEYKAFASFDSNSETALVDNCANTHIWNVHLQFENFREIPKSRQGVSTIGGQPHFAQGIGDVPTSWKDDNGDIFWHTLKDVLFFPDSPVKIISSSKLATEWGP